MKRALAKKLQNKERSDCDENGKPCEKCHACKIYQMRVKANFKLDKYGCQDGKCYKLECPVCAYIGYNLGDILQSYTCDECSFQINVFENGNFTISPTQKLANAPAARPYSHDYKTYMTLHSMHMECTKCASLTGTNLFL